MIDAPRRPTPAPAALDEPVEAAWSLRCEVCGTERRPDAPILCRVCGEAVLEEGWAP
jgi:hypothetical protein